MTSPDQQPNASDYRRAAVLTKYHRQGNTQGVLAIVDETNTADRAVQLLFAVLGLHKLLITRLRTEEGITLLADWIQGMAALEPIDAASADMIRGAQLLDLHGRDDREGIGRVMNAATADGRPTETFLRLLDHYEVALPELSGPAGITWLEAHIDALRTEEFKPDEDA